MCGFCGVLGPVPAVRSSDVPEMARAIAHRGPDDQGLWKASFAERGVEHEVALGHLRLSIVDLSSLGHQPMLSEDGQVVISYNGEVYNFAEIREELRAAGHRFRSGTDTEVLLEAYRAWGTASFDRFIGMFAFALWDGPRRRLLLVRDRLGIKPVYYQWRDGVLLFGSELKALRRHAAFVPEIDPAGLAHYLRNGWTSGERTIYRHARRLAPGSFLVWQGGEVRTERFWKLEEPEPGPAPSYEQAVEHLDALLGDAVERRLVADVPLGAFLSGGVDSSTVVALMQERARGRVRTFSIGFTDARFDEAPHARAVAAHLKTEHTELYVTGEQTVEAALGIADVYDEPFADASAIPTLLLSRLTRKHVTVALSGDGGDELLGGYDRYRKMARFLPFMTLPEPIRRAAAAGAEWAPHKRLRRGLKMFGTADPVSATLEMTARFRTGTIERATGGGDGSCESFARAYAASPHPDPLRRIMAGDVASYMTDDILAKVDRASMSVALEVRVPIIDHRVVRFALSLPRSVIWHGGQTKAPLRAVLERRVPRSLYDRPKHGFGIPIHELLANELKAWKTRYLDPARIREQGVLDADGVAALLAEAEANRGRVQASKLWVLICFQRWYARTHLGERDA